ENEPAMVASVLRRWTPATTTAVCRQFAGAPCSRAPRRVPLAATSPMTSLLSSRVFSMYIVHVFVHVKDAHIEAFKRESAANATASRRESGVVRFDVLQSSADPTRFVLVEVYRDVEASLAHKETVHYATWRDAVAPMMASPRTNEKYVNVDPTDAHWV